MKVTIDDCLEIDSLSKSQVLSGTSQGYRRVTSVSVMDGNTLDSILAENGKPNQLVLTSFQGYDGQPMQEELQIKIVKALAAAKIAGIAVFCFF